MFFFHLLFKHMKSNAHTYQLYISNVNIWIMANVTYVFFVLSFNLFFLFYSRSFLYFYFLLFSRCQRVYVQLRIFIVPCFFFLPYLLSNLCWHRVCPISLDGAFLFINTVQTAKPKTPRYSHHSLRSSDLAMEPLYWVSISTSTRSIKSRAQLSIMTLLPQSKKSKKWPHELTSAWWEWQNWLVFSFVSFFFLFSLTHAPLANMEDFIYDI